jgi:hypothetical protein
MQHMMKRIPRGKLPCVRIKGVIVPDSANIIRDLEVKPASREIRMLATVIPAC